MVNINGGKEEMRERGKEEMRERGRERAGSTVCYLLNPVDFLDIIRAVCIAALSLRRALNLFKPEIVSCRWTVDATRSTFCDHKRERLILNPGGVSDYCSL